MMLNKILIAAVALSFVAVGCASPERPEDPNAAQQAALAAAKKKADEEAAAKKAADEKAAEQKAADEKAKDDKAKKDDKKTPPPGTQNTPPAGDKKAPPTGTQNTPPAGDQKAPPTGTQNTPPAGDQKAPPTGDPIIEVKLGDLLMSEAHAFGIQILAENAQITTKEGNGGYFVQNGNIVPEKEIRTDGGVVCALHLNKKKVTAEAAFSMKETKAFLVDKADATPFHSITVDEQFEFGCWNLDLTKTTISEINKAMLGVLQIVEVPGNSGE